jgi:hypothetical protein
MNLHISPLIEKSARDLDLQINGSPFHGAEGLEFQKQGRDADTLLCIGYILGPEKTSIYRRIESKKDVFYRNRLSFFYGWLIKPRPRDNEFRRLLTVPSSDFSDELFVAFVKKELAPPLEKDPHVS